MTSQDHEAPFVRSGRSFARRESDRFTPQDRQRHDAIMAFVVTWEALAVGPAPTSREEVLQIGRQAELIYQAAFLARLAAF